MTDDYVRGMMAAAGSALTNPRPGNRVVEAIAAAASTAPDLYLARDLHAPTVVTIDGADSRNPEGMGTVVICRTCSDWDGEDLIRAVGPLCDTAKALGVRG